MCAKLDKNFRYGKQNCKFLPFGKGVERIRGVRLFFGLPLMFCTLFYGVFESVFCVYDTIFQAEGLANSSDKSSFASWFVGRVLLCKLPQGR